MAWTKAQLIQETQNHADADGSSRWNSTTIARLLDVVYRREWSRILNANPTYRWAKRTLTTDSDGRLALSALSTATERLHRILQVQADDVQYPPLAVHDAPFMGGDPDTVATRGFYFLGSQIQVLPQGANVSIDVYVNHLPPAITSLANEDAVVFPEDYEMLLAFEGAVLMLSKGAAETGAGAEIAALAEAMRGDMLADLARRAISPMQIGFSDAAGDYGA